LDIWKGQVGPNGTQVTSTDPGNEPDGLFWTVLLPCSSVQVHPRAGIATYQVSNLVTTDFGNTMNDLKHGPSVPATVSFIVHWSGVTSNTQRWHLKPTNPGGSHSTKPFAGKFVVSQLPGNGTATMQWSTSEGPASSPTLQFVTDWSKPSECLWTVVGRERNGVFFDHDDDDHDDDDHDGGRSRW
jgi:hypothetical protein